MSDDSLPTTDAEWRERLSPFQYHVLREKGTERAFTGALWDHKKPGRYHCAGCDQLLFRGTEKYSSGCGWPSFTQAVESGAVKENIDLTHGMRRVEVVCSRCDGHLGHVFNDGPPPLGTRYCINSASITFEGE